MTNNTQLAIELVEEVQARSGKPFCEALHEIDSSTVKPAIRKVLLKLMKECNRVKAWNDAMSV